MPCLQALENSKRFEKHKSKIAFFGYFILLARKT
jgi:hypothetical protein